MREFFSSRSRQESGLRCSRHRYYSSEWNGTGLESSRASVPLATGGAVHTGLAQLMSRVTNGHGGGNIPYPPELFIDSAVEAALVDYDAKCKDRGFQLRELESASQTYNEQRALVEALVRLGGLVVIPRLLETYEVLEVEREDQTVLVQGTEGQCEFCLGEGKIQPENWSAKGAVGKRLDCPQCQGKADIDGWNILWKSIPDALLRNRESGELFLLSWKTTSEYSSQKDDDARVDVQGQSEAWAWESRIGIALSPSVEQRDGTHLVDVKIEDRKIRGIQMVYLAKGPRRKEELPDGTWIQKTQNPLIYGYGKDLGGLAPEYASSLFWKCTEPHPFKWAKGGTCPGGKGHKRGDEWKSFPVWEAMGIPAWIDMICAGKVQGAENILESLFAIPMPHYRSPGKLESWLLQAQSLEVQRAKDLIQLDNSQVNIMGGDPRPLDPRELDRLFPQGGMWTGSCANWFWSRCAFFELCHGPSHVQEDPIGSGIYQIRTKREDLGKANENE